jgi:hypothetical protein
MDREQDVFDLIKEFVVENIKPVINRVIKDMTLDKLRQLQEKFLAISDLNYVEDLSSWHIYSAHNSAELYYEEIVLRSEVLTEADVERVYEILMYGDSVITKEKKIYYTLPFLENYSRTRRIEDTVSGVAEAEEKVNKIAKEAEATLRIALKSGA